MRTPVVTGLRCDVSIAARTNAGPGGDQLTSMKIPARDADGINVLVEIPAGSRNKYEYDNRLGRIRLSRTLYTAVRYPIDYGFVPGTRAPDGDPLDVLVMVEEPTFPGCILSVRLIGLLVMEDDGGVADTKLLAVPVNEPRFASYQDVTDVPAHRLAEIEHFFSIYKDLEGKHVVTRGWRGMPSALDALDGALLPEPAVEIGRRALSPTPPRFR
jgi:inorganic pyrophosphatase